MRIWSEHVSPQLRMNPRRSFCFSCGQSLLSGTAHGCSMTVEVDCWSRLYSLVKANYLNRAVSVSGHELLILRLIFLSPLGVNCVTCAFAGASAVCVTVKRVFSCMCNWRSARLRACVRGCFANWCTCAHHAHTQRARARACVWQQRRRQARKNPGLVISNYFCWVIAWQVSSLCAAPIC